MSNQFGFIFKIIRWELYIMIFLFLYCEYPEITKSVIWSLL